MQNVKKKNTPDSLTLTDVKRCSDVCGVNVVSGYSLGAATRLESVGEDDELTVENGDVNYEIAIKYSRGGRKHSLPQHLDTGTRQV